MKQIQNLLQGKKTIIVSLVAIGAGYYLKDINLMVIGVLGLTGGAKLDRVTKQLIKKTK